MKNLRTSATLLALGAAVLTVGCGDDDIVNPTPTARVRVVNLNPSAASVGLFADGTAIGSNVAFGAAGSCISVPVGRALTFRTAGQTTNLAPVQNAGITANQPYTIVLFGNAASPQTSVLSDAGVTAPSAGNAAVRFFNASGAGADLYVTTPTGALPATANIGNLLAGQSTTSFGAYPTANTLVRVYNVGSTAAPAFSTAIGSSLSTNRIGNVFLTNAPGSGGTNASLTTAPCT